MAYVRVSTEAQSEETGLESQRQAIAAYAATHQLEIRTWYSDVIPGAREARPGLDALREAAGRGEVSSLLVYRIDRLARSVRIGETIVEELRAAGVTVVSVSEAMLDNSMMGSLMRSIVLAFAQYERSVIVMRTTAGRRLRVSREGSWSGGVPPYGYQAVAGDGGGHRQLRIDEDQAAAVRRVFALRDEGRSLPEIAGLLNESGARTAKGSRFAPMQVARILARRDVYEGLTTATPSIVLNAGVDPQQDKII